MGEIVNLRRARKKRAAAVAEEEAAANRLAYGRSKGENRAAKAERVIAERRLDSHRLQTPPSDGE
jgi:Domain of unknown function (DUF4169)